MNRTARSARPLCAALLAFLLTTNALAQFPGFPGGGGGSEPPATPPHPPVVTAVVHNQFGISVNPRSGAISWTLQEKLCSDCDWRNLTSSETSLMLGRGFGNHRYRLLEVYSEEVTTEGPGEEPVGGDPFDPISDPFPGETSTQLITQYSAEVLVAIDDTYEMPVSNDVLDDMYYARKGDINGDGLRDIFISGASNRAVGDFFLLQQSDKSFSVLEGPTATQVNTANEWPLADLQILRDDLNFDGYFDFWIINVDQVVLDADDIIVITQKGSGETPVFSQSLDDDFLSIVGRIAEIFSNSTETMEGYDRNFCVERVVTEWIDYNCPVDVYEHSWVKCGDWVTREEEICWSGVLTFAPWERTVIVSQEEYLRRGGPDCLDCADEAKDQAEDEGFGVILESEGTSRAGSIWKASLGMSAILVADDAFGVGVLNDPLIPVFLVGGGLTATIVWTFDTIDKSPSNDISTPASPDPFDPGPDCDPEDPNVQQLSTRDGSFMPTSKRLRENMERTGCLPDVRGVEAHHIVARKGGDADGQAARNILSRNNIDIDNAINGVGLPKHYKHPWIPPTRAANHSSLHTEAYYARILERLVAAEESNGAIAVRAELRRIAQELLTQGKLL